jgi:thiamine pyrophosphate-dependent acetolactate synthase large subunit-like protein
VRSQQATGADETREALRTAIASREPELIEVRVAPGMAMF